MNVSRVTQSVHLLSGTPGHVIFVLFSVTLFLGWLSSVSSQLLQSQQSSAHMIIKQEEERWSHPIVSILILNAEKPFPMTLPAGLPINHQEWSVLVSLCSRVTQRRGRHQSKILTQLVKRKEWLTEMTRRDFCKWLVHPGWLYLHRA